MDIFQLLKEWFHSEKTDIEPSLLAYVLLYSTQQTTGLIDIVDYLTTIWKKGEIAYKVKCIELLAQVVTPSQSSLDVNTVDAVLQFLGDRLRDNVSLPRCIDILSVLIHTDTISGKSTIALCDILFRHIKVKKQSQQSRLKILCILAKSVERYPSEIQRSKITFIDDFIHCMDGEKDPRNLLVAFDLVRAIIDRFDISRHIEDLFEVVFCYFPISFAAPNHADLSITTEDLKISLRRCLAATPYFAFYATPLLIEKLLTTKGSAKKDVMETISLCAPAYGAHAILPHAQDLFDALVKEVYEGADATMVEIALQTIHHVVATLGTGISIANIRDPVERAIDGLLQTCVQALKQPELKHARSAASILRAAASASDPACTSVTHTAVPIIYQQYTSVESAGQQKAILDILTELLIASKTLYGSVEDVGYDRDFQTPLLMYKQQILQMFILSLADSSATHTLIKQASLKGFHEMVLMKHFLKQEEIYVAIGHLTHQLVLQEKEIRHLALSILGVIAKLYPVSIGQHTFPVLLNTLASRDTPTVSEHYRDALEAIKVLGAYPAVFVTVIHSLVDRLDYACSFLGQPHSAYIHDLATTLLSIYRTASKHTDVLALGRTFLLPYLLSHCTSHLITESWYLDDILIDQFAMIIAITLRLSDTNQQSQSVQDAFRLFVQGDLSVLDPNSMSQENAELSIFNLSKNDRTDVTLLFTAIVGNCRRDVQLPVYDVSEFLKKSIQTAIQSPSRARQLALSKMTSSIINKSNDSQLIHSIQQVIKEELIPHLKQPNALTVFVWIIKSLIQKGHAYGFELLDSVIQMSGAPEIGKEAADSFVVLLEHDELVLNKASHAIVSVLYKQRVFNHCVRKLMQGSEQKDILHPEIQIYYLTALIHLIQHIPQQVTINELYKLMVPIISALSTEDPHLVQSTLRVVQHIVPNAQGLVMQHMGSFIHALLRITQSHTVTTRILALDCLCEIARKGKSDTLSPFKPSVVKELGIALDDKKRVVRKHAVDCRETWFTIGK